MTPKTKMAVPGGEPETATKTEDIDSVNSNINGYNGQVFNPEFIINSQLEQLRIKADREITHCESAISQKNRRKAKYHKRMAVKCMVKIEALKKVLYYGGAFNG